MEAKPAIVGSSFLHNGTLYEITGILNNGIVVRDTNTQRQYSLSHSNAIYAKYFGKVKAQQAPKPQPKQELDWNDRNNLYIDTLIKISDEVEQYTASAVLAKLFATKATKAFIAIFATAYLYKDSAKFTMNQLSKIAEATQGKINTFKEMNEVQLNETLNHLRSIMINHDNNAIKQLYTLIPSNYIERDLTTIFISKNGIKQNNLQFYYINNKTLKAYLKEFIGDTTNE